MAEGKAETKKRRTSISEFARQVRTETSKVVWPTRAETANLTLVVIVVAVAVGILLGVVDFGFSRILENVLLP